MEDQKPSARSPRNVRGAEGEGVFDVEYLINELSQFMAQPEISLDSYVVNNLEGSRLLGSNSFSRLLQFLLDCRATVDSGSQWRTSDFDLLRLALRVLIVMREDSSPTFDKFQLAISDALREADSTESSAVATASTTTDANDDTRSVGTWIPHPFDDLSSASEEEERIQQKNEQGALQEDLTPRFVPIAPRPRGAKSTLQGQDSKRHPSMKTIKTISKKKRKKKIMKCGFCRKPKKLECDCIQQFPRELVEKLLKQLPADSEARQELGGYRRELQRRIADTRRRARNNAADEWVYGCPVCRIDVKEGHVCRAVRFPRCLLEQVRRELPPGFPLLGVMDVALHSRTREYDSDNEGKDVSVDVMFLFDLFMRATEKQTSMGNLYSREVKEADQPTLDAPTSTSSATEDDTGDGAANAGNDQPQQEGQRRKRKRRRPSS